MLTWTIADERAEREPTFSFLLHTEKQLLAK